MMTPNEILRQADEQIAARKKQESAPQTVLPASGVKQEPRYLSETDMGFDAPARGLKGWGQDIAATAVKGAIAVPEAAVGLMDIPTGGRVGKFLENKDGAFGFRPKEAKEAVNEWHSDATKEAQQKFQQADGLVDKFGVALQNPSLIATTVGESLPIMFAGGLVGRGIQGARGLMAAREASKAGLGSAAATKAAEQAMAKGATLAGAAGEGVMMAGSAAEQIRQETDDGLLTPGQAGLALATGVAGGAFGYAGGKLAQRLGIGDADTMLAQGIKGMDKQFADAAARSAANPLVAEAAIKSIPRKVIEGAITEGFLEELPQSMAEQIFQNIALGKDWHEELDSAAVMGVLAGGAMGAGAAGFHGFRSPAATPADDTAPAPGADPAAPAAEAAPQQNPGLARVSSEFAARLQALQEQEEGDSQGLQSATTYGDAVLAQQQVVAQRQAQEQAVRDAQMAESRAVESPDDEIYQSTGATAPRPSEAMGLRTGPDAGPLENAAALSVDTGTTAQMQQAAVLAEAAEAAQKAKPETQKQERQSKTQQQEIDQETGEILSGPALADWSDADLSTAFRNAQSKDVRLQLANELGRRRAEREESALQEELREELAAASMPDAPDNTFARTQEDAGPVPKNIEIQDDQAQTVAPGANAEGANVATLAQLNRKKLAEMSDDELQQLSGLLPADHSRQQKIKKAIQDRAAQAQAAINEGAKADGTQTNQTQQAQPQQPAPRTAAGQAIDSAPTAAGAQAPQTTPITPNAAPNAGVKQAQAAPAVKALPDTALPAGKAAQNQAQAPAAPQQTPTWATMPTDARQQVARAAGLNPVQTAKALKSGSIEEMPAAIADKLADAMGTTPAQDSGANEPENQFQSAPEWRAGPSAQSSSAVGAEADAADVAAWNELTPSGRRDAMQRAGVKLPVQVTWENMQSGVRDKMRPAVRAVLADDASAPAPANLLQAAKDSGKLEVVTVGDKPAYGEVETEKKTERKGRIESTLNAGGYVQGDELRTSNGMTLMKLTAKELESVPVSKVRQPPNKEQMVIAATAGKSSDQPASKAHQAQAAPKTEAKQEQFANNKLFTADKVAAARERMRKKLGTLNSGIDPELLVDGMTIAGAYIESGIRSFADYAKAMVEDMGDGVKPYLLSFWEGARNYPGLDTTGMTDPAESARQHQALLTPDVREQAAEQLGTTVKKPAQRTRKTGATGDMTLTQDWGVEHIDGYADGSGTREIGNATKDAFLKEAKQYLSAVANELAVQGFEPHADHKGKPGKAVSVNESGMAGSGDVSLTMRHPDSNTNVYVHVGDTALRGMFPSTPSGIAVMARTSQAQGDTYANKGQNRWMPVDLSASDLASLLLSDARATMEAQTRTTETKEVNNGNPEQAGRAADQGRTPEVSGRGGRDNDSAAPADSGDLEIRQPGDVPAPADAGRTGGDGLRVPAADVGRSGPTAQGGNVGNGRTRASGARASDAGSGEPAAGVRTERTGSAAAGTGRGQAEPTESRNVKAPEEVSPANPGPGNFHLDNPLEIVGGTPVARFDKNMAAIELLNTLRESERQATAEEQRTLAGYTGWGSFGQELFQGTWAKPMPKPGWEKRDQWLRDHLGQDEWESAQRSITNAHYTDPPTVMAMWDMVKRMGFGGGRVLEPSMGIGNFFGMMPADIKGRSQLAGIELDSLTGAMAQRLYPDANIKIMGYQESKTPDNFYDVVIGNWPFENTVIADRRYNTLSPFLHDYFFLKALDQARPGGLVVGITSNGTMDKKATRIRAALARKAELVTSIRLPSGAFQEYAGTKVVTDIVILKKRDKALSLTPNEPWINSVAVKTPAGPEVFINEFYAQNPGNVIGTTDYGHGTTRMQPGMIVHRPENMAERLREAVNLVPEGVFSKEDRTEHISYVTNHTADREGSLTEQGGKLFVVRGEHLATANEVRKYALKSDAATAKRDQELRALIDMRRKYATLIEAERSGAAEDARKALREAYEAFNQEHGPLEDSFGLAYLEKIDDPFYPALAALTVNGKPSDILTKSTIRGARGIENPTAQDAYVLARNKSVAPSLQEIAALAGKPEAEVRAELVKSGAVFEAPNGDVVPSDIYLSGNVRQKLREAQAALDDGNKAMERNVAELKKVIPEDVPYFNIESQLGATWVPAKAYAEYVAHMLNRTSADGIEATFLNGRWKIRLPDGANHWTEARTGFGTGQYPFSKLVNAAFTNQTVKIRRKDVDGNEYVDTEATDEANARIADIRTKFAEWLWSDPERRAALEAEYNESRNAYATPKYDGSFLSFEGMALSLGRGPFNLREHQVNAIWRALVNRRSINAHEVGTGKTFTMGGIAVESRRYGIAKKPLLLAHNANSASVAAEIQQMYPAAKVLYIDNLDKDSIAVRMRQIANDDWDTIVMPHSLIDRLSFREETLMEMAREDIRALEEEAYAAAEEDGVTLTAKMMEDEEELKKVRSVTAKELVKARNRIIETVKKQAMQSSREGAIPFEDLGIDMVLVDEAHEFKKPPISTRMNMKGLNTQTSNRSIALQFITRYIRANNFGGNVHTFTGTPITNTLTEIFHQMRYVMEDEMKAAGVESWDGWFGSFAKEVQDVELSAAGEYEAINRLAGFINVPELRRMIGQYMDVVFADDMPEMQPRQVNGKTLTSADLSEAERAELLNGRSENALDRPYKKVINVTSDLTDEQSRIFAELQGYARRWRNMTGKERKEAMYAGAPESPIITEGLANKASFDVRLMQDEAYAGQEGNVPDDPGSKASKVVGNVLEIYNSDDRTAQVIFAEQGFSTSKDKSMGRDPSGKKITRRVKTFSTMRDIVERLVQGGIPREQIAIVDGSTSKEKRKEIADAMNALTVRVVIGSTDTLGVGVNMQRNLRAMHHMDAPYMPGELEQRNGRGLRQGNQWNTVLEYRYMTDRLDGRRWQILAIKQRFITAFMKASSDNRVIEGDAASDEENDIVQSFSEAAGDPRILIRAKLRKNVEALQRAERMHGNGVADARRNMRNAKDAIEWNRGVLQKMTANGLPQRLRAMMQAQSEGFVATVQGKAYDARKDAEEAIDKFLRTEMRMEQSGVKVGTYRDQAITARWPSLSSTPELVMEVDGQEFSSGSLRGLEQQVRNFPGRIEKIEGVIAKHEASIERLDQVSRAPFARAADLENAVKRLAALEKDIEVNPVPPPAWLRAGAPVDSEAFRAGQPFVVTGHRWNKDGWFVLGQDAKGEMAMPYNEVTDAQGMPLYEERQFQAPEVIEKEDKKAKADVQPASVGAAGTIDQTETEAFKRWFGNSKAVDENGKPLVMYHGTGADFSVFDDKKRGSHTREVDARQGFFLTSSPEIANEYAEEAGANGGANIMPAYVSLQNPLVIDEGGRDYDAERFRDYIDQAQEQGHDGVLLRNTGDGMFKNGRTGDTVIAFRSEQIKSAIGNNGQFDPANPDIRYSRMDDNAATEGVSNEQRQTPNGIPAGLPATSDPDSQYLERRINNWLQTSGWRADRLSAVSLPIELRTALDRFTDATGTRVVLFRNLTPEIEDFNGVNFRDGRVFINETSQHPATLTAAHEWVHNFKRTNPKLYQQLEDEVREQGRIPQWHQRNIKEEGMDRGIDHAIEELTAAAVSDAMTDPAFLEQLALRNQGVFRRVAQAFLDFLDTLTSGWRDQGSNAYLRDVQAFRDKLAQVLDQLPSIGQDAANFAANPARRPGSAQDKAVMQAIADGKTTRDVLRLVANGSKDPFLRQVARLLLKAGITPNIQFGYIGKTKKGNPIYGQYRGKSDTIAIAGSAEYAAERIFMHEAMHAATMRALAKPGLPRLQLQKLLEHVRKQPGVAGFYGTKNVDEFVAEVFTNPDFQAALRTMSAPAGSPLKSAWHSFVQVLRRILGLGDNSTSALSQALELGVAAVREDMVLRKRGARMPVDADMRKAHILQGEPVAVLSLEDAPAGGYADIARWAAALFAQQGGKAVSPDIGEVTLNEQSARDSMAHGGANAAKKIAFAAVKDVIERGALVYQAKHGRVDSFYVSAPVRISGRDNIVTALVRRDQNTKRMYLHSVSLKENLLKPSVSAVDAKASELSSATTSGDSATLAKAKGQGKAASSDVARELNRLLTLDTSGDQKDAPPHGTSGNGMPGISDRSVLQPSSGGGSIVGQGMDSGQDGVANFGVDDFSRNVGEGIKSITATNIKKAGSHKLTDWLKLGLQFLGRRQLTDVYGDLIPQMRDYDRLAAQMEADKNESGANADELVRRWAKLPDEGKLADLMHEATLAQVDADADVAYVAGDDKAQSAILKNRFKALSPEAQAVYREARDGYKAHHEKVRKAIRERIERSELSSPKRHELLAKMDDDFFQKVKGVYFPLARFGRYVTAVKDGTGQVVSVSRAETMPEAESARVALLKAFPAENGFSVGRVTLDKEFVASHKMVGRGFMTDLYRSLEGVDLPTDQLAELEDTLGQLYLSSLPDLSWAKHGIHRKGTPGFSQDARRAFAQNMFHGARYLAKLRYSDVMQDSLDAMQEHVDEWGAVTEEFDQPKAQRVVDEMLKRHDAMMNPKSNPLSTAMTSFGFLYYLGLSPAAAMVNLSQTALVAYPVMAGKWGYKKSADALLRASKESVAGKNNIRTQLTDKDEIAAYEQAVNAGVIDVTMAHDLAGIAQGEDQKVSWALRPVMRMASYMFHQAELFNRQSTFIAAFRLAREAGNAPADAYEQAVKATYDGHFDYGAANRPRVMQGNVARVVLLFKQFGQNMIYTMARQAYQSVAGKSPEERRQARKVFAGLMTTHAMAAGVLGLPLVGPLLAAASMLGSDDDEPWDAEVALRNMLAEAVGQKPAEVLAKGVSRLTPWDVSGRVGLDKLIFPDVREGLEGQRWAETFATGMLGPVMGIGTNAARAAQKIGDGDYGRALEDLLPIAARNPIKAARYWFEGAQDRSGVAIKDEVSSAGALGQLVGFSPSEVRLAQEGKTAVMDADRRLNERRAELTGKFAKAVMKQDQAGMDEARQEIAKFNEKNPGRRITAPQLWQSVRRREQRIREAENGVYLPNKRRDAMDAGRFAFEQ